MTDIIRAAGMRAPEHRATQSQSGEVTPQPTIFTRSDGTQLHFQNLASFMVWWNVQQRRKADAESQEIS